MSKTPEVIQADREREVLGMVKEAIGQLRMRRAREIIGSEDQLHWLGISLSDVPLLVEIIGDQMIDGGGPQIADIEVDSDRVETVAELAKALTSCIFPAPPKAEGGAE